MTFGWKRIVEFGPQRFTAAVMAGASSIKGEEL